MPHRPTRSHSGNVEYDLVFLDNNNKKRKNKSKNNNNNNTSRFSSLVRHHYSFTKFEAHSSDVRDVAVSSRSLCGSRDRLFASITNTGDTPEVVVTDPQRKEVVAYCLIDRTEGEFDSYDSLMSVCFLEKQSFSTSSSRYVKFQKQNLEIEFSLLLTVNKHVGVLRVDFFKNPKFDLKIRQAQKAQEEEHRKKNNKQQHQNNSKLGAAEQRERDSIEKSLRRQYEFIWQLDEDYHAGGAKSKYHKLTECPYFHAVSSSSSSPSLVAVAQTGSPQVPVYNCETQESVVVFDTQLSLTCGVDFSPKNPDLLAACETGHQSRVLLLSVLQKKVLCVLSKTMMLKKMKSASAEEELRTKETSSVIRSSFTMCGNFIACGGSNGSRIRVFESKDGNWNPAGAEKKEEEDDDVCFKGFISLYHDDDDDDEGEKKEEGKQKNKKKGEEDEEKDSMVDVFPKQQDRNRICGLSRVQQENSSRIVAAFDGGEIAVFDCRQMLVISAFTLASKPSAFLSSTVYGMCSSGSFMALALDTGNLTFIQIDPFELRKIVFQIAERSSRKTRIAVALDEIYILKVLVASYLA